MAAKRDYVKLRAQAQDSETAEEQVQVNQRNLIDKILARYATEWSTLRELIQNAADALAKRVVVKFETLPSSTVPVPNSSDPSVLLQHVLAHHTLARLVVSNDGQPFRSTDWARLKNIAEGNPDETKIGAFGVGFYSVFNDCDEPFVVSALETMSFYWKGNSLFTKRGRVANDQSNSETCFILDYRNSTFPMPNFFSLCQFLSTSLTFVGLQNMELWLDNWNLLTLSKNLTRPAPIAIPPGTDPVTKDKMMKIIAVTSQTGQIDAEYMNVVGWTPSKPNAKLSDTFAMKPAESGSDPTSLRGLFSKIAGVTSKAGAAARKAAKEEEATQQAITENLVGNSRATILVRLTTANVQTYCSRTLVQELERATKKPPPKATQITVLTTPYDPESNSVSAISGSASSKAEELFSSVLPKEGRIFIGFRTAQTTGFQAHISAPSVIPTVEREHIDLSARYVSAWNIEILRAAGIVGRIGYASEMESVREKLSQSTGQTQNNTSSSNIASAIPAGLHVITSYTFGISTPSSLVSRTLEEAFWDSNSKTIDILSTRGVLSSRRVRATAENLSFVSGIPVLPKEIIDGAPKFLEMLHSRGMIHDMTIQDIRTELDSKALEEDQLTEFLKWAGTKTNDHELDGGALHTLFEVTVVNLTSPRAGSPEVSILALRDITSFVNNTGIPVDVPLPLSTIPFQFTRTLSKSQLLSFDWQELQILDWIQFLLNKNTIQRLPKSQQLTQTLEFAVQVLQVLSKQWESLSQTSRSAIVQLLSDKSVIPTKLGLRQPSEAYFPSVKLFDDLATLKGLHGVKEKFLQALGVRKTVELNVVFDRLMAGSKKSAEPSDGKWSHVELIKYLVSVKDDIPKQEIERLRMTPMCTAEGERNNADHSARLYKVSELYQPGEEFRALGLPTLKWHGPLRLSSAEGLFLLSLGLKKYPSVPELVRIMIQAASQGNQIGWTRAMRYFIDFHHHNGYASFNLDEIQSARFLPVMNRPFPDLYSPSACYANSKAAILGYNILREDLQPHAVKLGVRTDPPIVAAADKLITNPPTNAASAKNIFGYFSGRLAEINTGLAEKLGSSLIVPISSAASQSKSSSETSRVRYTAPRMCFLGDPQVYGKILDFVDFGQDANSFLLKVGSKHEPSSVELAQIVAQDPVRLLDTLGQDKYIDLLRKLAENQPALKANKDLWAKLKRRPCLLGYRDLSERDNKSRDQLALKELSIGGSKSTLNDNDDYDDDEPSVREWSLAVASSIIVIDTVEDFTLFRDSILAAPQEENLETFYMALGSPTLSSLIEVERRIGQRHSDQTAAQKLRKLILDRTRIFLHDHHTSKIHHDSRWLEKSLAVQFVNSIAMRKTLRGYNLSHMEKRSAALTRDSQKGIHVLSVTSIYDMYEVSQALVHILLTRPKHQDTMALEMILSTDLRKLKARGFNVDRILRQQAIESRIAEDKRKKLLEEEQRRKAEERELEVVKTPKKTGAGNGISIPVTGPSPSTPRAAGMPGSFGNDSPDHVPTSIESHQQRPQVNKSVSDFFSNITRRLGVEDGFGQQSKQQKSTGTGGQVDTITSPKALEQNLVSAIQSSRSHESKTLFSAPKATTITEAEGAYCDSAEGHDLTFVSDTVSGMKVYMNRQDDMDFARFVNDQAGGLNSFAFLLLDCGSVFQLAPQSLHIFYSPTSKAIAFNQNGSIFCNYHFFAKLQLSNFQGAKSRADAAVYWFVVLCHELAHNLVSNHDSKHSFYTESFVQQYFRKMVAKAAQYE